MLDPAPGDSWQHLGQAEGAPATGDGTGSSATPADKAANRPP